MSNSEGNRFIRLLLSLYMATVAFAAVYYNWEYASDNGFVRWVILGEIVPTAKALVWPYFAFGSNSSPESEVDRTRLTTKQIAKAEVNKFILAINYSQQASYLLNSTPHEDLADYPNLKDILAYRHKAVDVAEAVDPGILNQVFPDLGTRFKSEFQQAMTLFVHGCETNSNDELRRSKLLNDQWADWYMANRKAIEDASNEAIGTR
jgi:hypothetical protein